MSDLENQCKLLFGSLDLYKIFEINKKSKPNEIKKAYYQLSLKYHPDKISDIRSSQKATSKFQILSKIYSILSDTEKRKIYDETGILNDENISFSKDEDWISYWRQLFKKISLDDIKKFEVNFQGSEQERLDVIDAYKKCKGEMQCILENVMCAKATDDNDETRFRAIIDEEIANKNLTCYKVYKYETPSKKSKRKRKAKKEAKEAEAYGKKLGLDNLKSESLVALINQRQKTREHDMNDLFQSLENKYCKGKLKIKK
ncbi:unnamed protein product [Gordionus sp. m RMFG-2023]|uniref:dnaJ homolog subfamily C member 9-like n=1 Tax=Gordionus sp. m RMFG-2023 TaxID=3053472 RepID=UPI0030E01912